MRGRWNDVIVINELSSKFETIRDLFQVEPPMRKKHCHVIDRKMAASLGRIPGSWPTGHN